MHPACLRRPDVDMLELVLGRDFAFAQFRDFSPHVAELLGHFAARVFIDLNDLQLGLGRSCRSSRLWKQSVARARLRDARRRV